MRKVSKNSKAVLGAATFLLFAFAGAHAGAGHLQLQRLDSSALRSQGLSPQAMLHRLPAMRPHFKVAKNFRPAGNSIAETSMVSFAPRLGHARAATCVAQSANDVKRGCSQLTRAPPLS